LSTAGEVAFLVQRRER